MIARDLWALWDVKAEPERRTAAFRIHPNRAHDLNNEGYGIFQTINDFGTERRLKENLKGVLSWAIDIDTGSKQDQFELIKRSLLPSLVVESQRGYHIYWDAVDGTLENWQDIVEFRLIPFFDGDLGAKDVCRILRVPGYLHTKYRDDKFLVREVLRTDVVYTADEMARCFPSRKKETSTKMMKRHLGGNGNTLSDRIYNLDCIEALSRLSGTALVGGEVYTFRRNGNGNHNILVNGKTTSCFVDQQGRIGAIPGGPTIWTWLRFFNHKDQDIAKYLREYFPEIWKGI